MSFIDNRDFTLAKYKQLCVAIVNSKYTNMTFKDYLLQKGKDARCYIILRHDIDENVKYALDIAKVEHECGLMATYYFRMKKKTYVNTTINEISNLKHEIGYHYETMDKCNGDIEKALVLFNDELAIFRQQYDVKTVCMHGNPLTKYDNEVIWQKKEFKDFGLLGEPYLSLDYSKFAYFSDSGRTWDQNPKKKTKDKVISYYNKSPHNTDELISMIKNSEPQNICLLTHPERWSKNLMDYSKRYMIDMAYIIGKTLIHWQKR